jgi:hypothetical protein
MRNHIDDTGFSAPSDRALGQERRTVAVAHLVATVGLTLGTLIAAMAVTAGIARANVAGQIIDNEGGLFALALVLGLFFIAMVGLTVMSLPPGRKSHR